MMTATTKSLKYFRTSSFSSVVKRSFSVGMSINSASSQASGPIYHWHEEVENLERYCPGGCHPIQLGDEFSRGRYRIIHKLGYGSFSTVWLARDHLESRYVSLKVMTAAVSKLNLETKIRRRLLQGSVDHPGRSFIMSQLDEFYFEGPNGRHRCTVNEVVGTNVADAKEIYESEMLPLETARKITAQIASGVAYIHSCGVVHGG